MQIINKKLKRGINDVLIGSYTHHHLCYDFPGSGVQQTGGDHCVGRKDFTVMPCYRAEFFPLKAL